MLKYTGPIIFSMISIITELSGLLVGVRLGVGGGFPLLVQKRQKNKSTGLNTG